MKGKNIDIPFTGRHSPSLSLQKLLRAATFIDTHQRVTHIIYVYSTFYQYTSSLVRKAMVGKERTGTLLFLYINMQIRFTFSFPIYIERNEEETDTIKHEKLIRGKAMAGKASTGA